MRTSLSILMGLAATIAVASAQPAPGAVARRSVSVAIDRAVGGIEASVMRRMLRGHAETCQRRGLRGTARLSFALADRRDRRGLRVQRSTGAARLGRCLRRELEDARWPTGSLDGVALYSVTIRITP